MHQSGIAWLMSPVSGNGMILMDESLGLLPVVEALDLSRKPICQVGKSAEVLYIEIPRCGIQQHYDCSICK